MYYIFFDQHGKPLLWNEQRWVPVGSLRQGSQFSRYAAEIIAAEYPGWAVCWEYDQTGKKLREVTF